MDKEKNNGLESNSSESNLVNCIVCFEKIHPSAKKCVHCNSFQDWRRHINFSSTVLALLVALVSVLSISVPMLKDALTTPKSNVILSFQSFDNRRINVIASNTGEEAGSVIDRVYICRESKAREILNQDEELTYDAVNKRFWGFIKDEICLFGASEEGDIDFLLPKKSENLKFKIKGDVNNFLIDNVNHFSQVMILMQVVQFDGSRKDYIFYVSKDEFWD